MKALRARLEANDSVERFERLGVDVFPGEASLESPHSVRVDGTLLRARNIVLATGGRAAVPDVPGLKEAGYETNETIFERETPPGHLLVLGGGPIGCELAQAMVRLGSKVTLIDRGPHVLHREDADVTALVQARMEKEGVRLLLRARVESVVPGRATPHRVKVRREGGIGGPDDPLEIEADRILIAAGRTPNVEGLGLDRARVAWTSRGITVNAVCPGFVETAMTAPQAGALRQRYIDITPAGRIGNPEEIAAVIAFLAGPEASYVNGAVIAVDGGLTA